MSYAKEEAYMYKAGLTQPIEDFPSARRAALMLLMNAAVMEQDAEVPAIPYKMPSGWLGVMCWIK